MLPPFMCVLVCMRALCVRASGGAWVVADVKVCVQSFVFSPVCAVLP